MRRAQDVIALDLGRQRHGALDHGARALGSLDDLLRRLVDQLVIERLQTDPDSLVLHLYPLNNRTNDARFFLVFSTRKALDRPELFTLICRSGAK